MIVREGLPFIIFGIVVTAALILSAARWNTWIAFVLSLIVAVLTVFTAFFLERLDLTAIMLIRFVLLREKTDFKLSSSLQPKSLIN